MPKPKTSKPPRLRKGREAAKLVAAEPRRPIDKSASQQTYFQPANQ
ncbi:hypothetical protein CGRA01v4_08323 [Colletotrichum graminicola]|nr:hypothetical protein CGRA01v4_08323 [Colletotrichum graminicola]